MKMKTNFYKARLMGTCFLWAALATGGVLTSCSDDDDDLTQLTSPTGSEAVEATATSLTFTWNKMSNVIQYGYTLKDASGETLVTDVTSAHTITISGLQPRSTYTLEVTAYAAIGSDYSNSQPLVLTGSTLSYIQLEAPVVSTNAAARTTISWEAVDHADSYTYSYVKDGETVTGQTSDTYFTVDFLPLNEAVTISVYAESLGDDLYTVSETTSATVTRTREAANTVNAGKFDLYTMEDLGVSRTVTYYTDGSYTINAWYGTEGYDLEFLASESGELIVNAQFLSNYYGVDASADQTVWIYTLGDYGLFYGNYMEGGLYFWDSTAGAYYFLQWPVAAAGDVTELVAENVSFSGATFIETFYSDLYKTTQADGSVYYTFKNFFDGFDLKFTVDDQGYMSFTNMYNVNSYGYTYSLFGEDWYTSAPMYLTSEPGAYIDYSYFYPGACRIFWDNSNWSYLCLYYWKYDADGNYVGGPSDISNYWYEYLLFSLP